MSEDFFVDKKLRLAFSVICRSVLDVHFNYNLLEFKRPIQSSIKSNECNEPSQQEIKQ